jgi:hypothetical protein
MSVSVYKKGDYEEFHVLKALKNKANRTQTRMERGLFAYGARDCHGPSGLAMTPVSLFLCA